MRITPTAMALGEAAGMAAALGGGRPTRETEIPALQAAILRRGGIPGKRFV